MFSPDKLRKLEELAGKLAKSKVAWGSQWASDQTGAEEKGTESNRGTIDLEKAVSGKVIEASWGKYYHVGKVLTKAWPGAVEIVGLHRKIFGSGPLLDAVAAGPGLNVLAGAPPQAITYLDIETCGFCGNAIFLIGWCYFDGTNDFIVEQALARDYSEEAGILGAVGERLGRTRVLVTYNGKRFDLPSIHDRAVIHRVDIPKVPHHLDLLDQTRARWKKSLPNCQLQTVETYLCRRTRQGDIDGAEIPQAYHDFVKSLDARKLKTIIHHNFLDIVTLAEITVRLLAGQEPE